MENDFLATEKNSPTLKSHSYPFPKQICTFLDWDKSFCPDKDYVVRPDEQGISTKFEVSRNLGFGLPAKSF